MITRFQRFWVQSEAFPKMFQFKRETIEKPFFIREKLFFSSVATRLSIKKGVFYNVMF